MFFVKCDPCVILKGTFFAYNMLKHSLFVSAHQNQTKIEQNSFDLTIFQN